ncbi:MAG: PIG-L deacetylase family protein [Dehalococcoidales bacterium]|nr:PIG-L deacetylase family protein [Dehalococcoidales bacterium]
MTEQAQVMVVTPHPDDAEFGAAGTIARWTREGKSVIYVLCTNGDKGSSDPAMKPEELAKIREEEQLAAAKVLGVREVVFLRHPDQTLEDTSEFRKEIVRLIRMYRPETVVTTDLYRRYIWHRDHRITSRVTLDAIFPFARDYHAYPDLIAEGHMPHKVKEVFLWGSEEPNYCSDISDTFELKLAALHCHKSQVGDRMNHEMEERLMERCKTMAEGTDYELAEAFHRVEIWR